MKVERVEKEEWGKIAEDAHLTCFGEFRPNDFNRFNYALAVFDEDKIFAYATIIEMDADTCHMQHGGAFPHGRKSIYSYGAYEKMISYLREKYKFATTHILNTNTPMLRFAMKAGFVVVGVDCYGGSDTYLHLYNKLRGE